MANRDSILKSRDIANKGPSSQSYGFSSSHAWMWELDYEESWALKNWCFWPVMLEKTLENPLDCNKFQSVHPKGNQSWIFIGKTDAEAETVIRWPPNAKSWLIGKDPGGGKDWRQEEKGTTEDEMVAAAGAACWIWTFIISLGFRDMLIFLSKQEGQLILGVRDQNSCKFYFYFWPNVSQLLMGCLLINLHYFLT